jgi:hypothetical protein
LCIVSPFSKSLKSAYYFSRTRAKVLYGCYCSAASTQPPKGNQQLCKNNCHRDESTRKYWRDSFPLLALLGDMNTLVNVMELVIRFNCQFLRAKKLKATLNALVLTLSTSQWTDHCYDDITVVGLASLGHPVSLCHFSSFTDLLESK